MSRPGAAIRESTRRDAQDEPAPWPFETSLLVAGLRCTLRYIVLPLFLPLLGIATGAAIPVLLVLDAIAAVTILTTARRMWQVRHPSRWQYSLLATALVALVGAFFLNDVGLL